MFYALFNSLFDFFNLKPRHSLFHYGNCRAALSGISARSIPELAQR
jgi:hypothetical protein